MRYSDAVKTARMQAVLSALEGGALQIMDSGAVLATLTLEQPAGSVSGAALSLRGPIEAEAVADGTAVRAALLGRDGQPVVDDLTVGQSGNIRLDNPVIVKGQRVKVESFRLVHA